MAFSSRNMLRRNVIFHISLAVCVYSMPDSRSKRLVVKVPHLLYYLQKMSLSQFTGSNWIRLLVNLYMSQAIRAFAYICSNVALYYPSWLASSAYRR